MIELYRVLYQLCYAIPLSSHENFSLAEKKKRTAYNEWHLIVMMWPANTQNQPLTTIRSMKQIESVSFWLFFTIKHIFLDQINNINQANLK